MRNLQYVIIYLGISSLFFSVFAEQRATTPDGKQVILRDDGTWHYVTQSDKLADKLGKPNNADGTSDNKYDLTSGSGGGYSVNSKQETEDEPPRTALVDVIKGDKAFDVRKAKWGMSREEVKKSEKLQLLLDKKELVEYKFTLLGLNCKIRYKFSENKLVSAEYVIEQDDVNPSRFYEDYKALKIFLRQMYNAPVTDEKNWTNDIYKAEEKNWGFAISLGFLTCKTTWQNATTLIFLSQNGGNHMINTSIQYGMRGKQ